MMEKRNIWAFGTREIVYSAIGAALYTQYLFPFEATSILLLVAIVGATVLAKRRI